MAVVTRLTIWGNVRFVCPGLESVKNGSSVDGVDMD